MAKSDWADVGYGNLVKNSKTGQMVDKYHPVYTSEQDDAPTQVEAPPLTPNPSPTPTPTAAPTTPTPSAPKPGEGWVPTADGQGWLPPDRAGTPAAAPSTPPTSATPKPMPGMPAPTPSTPTTPQTPATPVTEPKPVAGTGTQAAPPPPGTTHSATPTAAPTQNTSNQGGQDVYRNTLIAQMAQDEIPDVNDKVIKAQLDPYRAEFTRQMRGEVRDEAEQAFAGGQDYGSPEKVAALERAGHKTGLMASDLVGRELQARRDQIESSLAEFGKTMSEDQRRALEKEQADLDRQLKEKLGDADIRLQEEDQKIRREGLAQTGALGGRELDIRERLGAMGLNSDMIRTILANLNDNRRLGLDAGIAEADFNRRALLDVMGT